MRKRMVGLAAAWVLLPAMAVAQDGAAPPSPPPQTLQQLFDAATAASSAEDYARAIELLTTMEQRTSNVRTLAIVRLRKGVALTQMQRWKEARPLLEQSVAALSAEDHSLDIDRGEALRALGRLALADLDYDAGLAYYGRATALATDPTDRISSLLGEAQAATFVDPAVALQKAEQAEKLIAAQPVKDKQSQGYAAAARGRALLNMGRFAEAESAFAKTVAAEGGLSIRVNMADLIARSDASIAAMLAGHRDKAREYLVYTGAGRLPKQDFTSGADMGLPVCGEEGIQPDDVAVIEFGITDKGEVAYARPIYGSRPGGMALVFARAVTRWSWRPEDVAKIPAPFRFVTRLELRCSTGEGGPSLAAGLRNAFRQWIEQQGVTPFEPDGVGEARRRAELESELARLRAQNGGGQSLAQASVLADLLANPLTAGEQATAHARALIAILDTHAPPPLARLYVGWLATEDAKGGKSSPIPEAPYAADPTARANLRLIRYDRLRPGEKLCNQALLDSVIDDPALPGDDPSRIAALTRRASARAAANDLTGARTDFTATGLTEQQCSVVDAQPALRGAPTSPADYPTDMVQVGVEGWTRVQFNISVDGRTLNQRAVTTYPPMIFSENGRKILSRARFEQSYRPASGLGCGRRFSTVNFRTPG
ncbi:MAG: hypothetical protein QM605_00260 [Sphingobium sp.]